MAEGGEDLPLDVQPLPADYTFYDADGVAKTISRDALELLLSRVYTPGHVQHTFGSRAKTDDEDVARNEPVMRLKTALLQNVDGNEVVADVASYSHVLQREEGKQLQMQDETRHTQSGVSSTRIKDITVYLQELVALQVLAIAQQEAAAKREEEQHQNQQHLLQREKEEAERERLDRRKQEDLRNENECMDIRRWDRKVLPVCKHGDPLIYFANFCYTSLRLDAPITLWPKLLCTQCNGVLADLLAKSPNLTRLKLLEKIQQLCGFTTEGLRVRLEELTWDQKDRIAAFMAECRRTSEKCSQPGHLVNSRPNEGEQAKIPPPLVAKPSPKTYFKGTAQKPIPKDKSIDQIAGKDATQYLMAVEDEDLDLKPLSSEDEECYGGALRSSQMAGVCTAQNVGPVVGKGHALAGASASVQLFPVEAQPLQPVPTKGVADGKMKQGKRDIIVSREQIISEDQVRWVREHYSTYVYVKNMQRFFQVPAFFHTRAQISSISSAYITDDQLLKNQYVKVPHDNQQDRIAPMAKIYVKYKHFEGEITVLVHDAAQPVKFILGLDLAYRNDMVVKRNPHLREAGAVNEICFEQSTPACQQKYLFELLQHHENVFSLKPGRTSAATHTITTADAPPIQSAPYRVVGEHAKQIEEELKEMLELGVIQPSKSLWASPVVLVPKKTPTDEIQPIHFCVDYRKLNQLIILDPYPIPHMEDLIEKIASKKLISTLHLSAGYWQVPLDPETREKSAFVTHKGLYEFCVLPVGLRSAPCTFQRLMDNVLHGLTFANAYLDDIVIFSDSFEEHLEHLKAVFERLQEARLTVKASECQWMMGKVVYLGHSVGSGFIEPLEAKVKSVKDWPIPQNKKQIQSFLELVGYYSKFIPHFSHIATPLTVLTHMSMPVKVKWTQECQVAFDVLKVTLVESPILMAPDFDKAFVLQTDASEFGVAAALLQRQESGMLRPVSFFSKQLLPHERAYSVPEKKCLAIVWALKKLRSYLWGRSFILQMDHQALRWLEKVRPTANQRLLHWALILKDFVFQIEYIPGKLNMLADCLSRMYFGVQTPGEQDGWEDELE